MVVVVIAAIGVAKTAVLEAPQQTLKVALVQPSFPQTLIWDPQGDETRFQQIQELSRQGLAEEPNLLIWPESGAPDMTPENQMAVTRLLAPHKAWMVFCVDSEEAKPDGSMAFYNSAVLLNPEGREEAIYHKRRLVMFGEYIPLIRWLPFLKFLAPIGSGFSPGAEPVSFVMTRPRAKMSVLICFEDVFASEAREHVDADTDFLINLTNDGWFGNGAAQWQQMASAVFRAVENGVPLMRCSNNGITCWIDAQGRLRQVLGWPDNVYGAGVMRAEIPLTGADGRGQTFYNRHGDWFGWGCAGISVVALVWTFRKRAV
jgi:apolipoprotein N-acyltransferase